VIKIIDNVLAFDSETTGTFPWPMVSRQRMNLAPDRPFMFQLANTDGEAVSFRGEVDPRTRRVSYMKCAAEMRFLRREVLGNPNIRVVGHNLPFERRMTIQPDVNMTWRCKIDDTRVMARVANPTAEAAAGEDGYYLKRLAKKYLGIPDDDLKALKKALQSARLAAKKRGWAIATKLSHGKMASMADTWLPELTALVKDYGEMDPVRTIGLWMMYRQVFQENREAGRLLYDVYGWERRVLKTSMRMERVGMTYLSPKGLELKDHYTVYMAKQRGAMKTLGYQTLNPQSSPQLKKVFIETLKRKAIAYTNSGLKKVKAGLITERDALRLYPKLDAEQLMAWARGSAKGADVDGDGPDGCKLSRALLEWKAGKKVIEYIDSYEFFKCQRGDQSYELHPAWDPSGARTGRYSCKDPNTMQIASAETSRRHSQIRARQREAFGPRPDYLWYMPDYSQIEVWVFAFGANEQAMMDALLSGEDFHLSTAGAAWGHRQDFCTCGVDPRWKHRTARELHKKDCLIKWWRQRAKMILFSRLYGGGIGKIAFLIRCSMEEAAEFVDQFNENLPGVKRFMDRTVQEVRETGTLINLFGREYDIDRQKAYKAVNYYVQGSSADIMKRAVVRVDEYLREEHPGSYVIGTVHDELLAEIHRDHHSAGLMSKVISLMQMDSKKVPNLPIPLPVGMKYTHTDWSHAKEVAILKRSHRAAA
jgi:DNA polymerase I-like protein with 3'-5' exonuclease and polymerase domains